eukprot:14027952-Heterocapsa_arctica.AAC.1
MGKAITGGDNMAILPMLTSTRKRPAESISEDMDMDVDSVGMHNRPLRRGQEWKLRHGLQTVEPEES